MDSITNAEEDQTGSREARLRLIDQGVAGVPRESAHRHRRRPVQELQRARRHHREVARDAQRLAAGRGRTRHLRAASRSPSSSSRGYQRELRGDAACSGLTRRNRAGRARRPSRRASRDRCRATHAVDSTPQGMLAAIVGWTICAMFAVGGVQLDVLSTCSRSRCAGREVVAPASRRRPEPPAAGRRAVASALDPGARMSQGPRAPHPRRCAARRCNYAMFAPVHRAMA